MPIRTNTQVFYHVILSHSIQYLIKESILHTIIDSGYLQQHSPSVEQEESLSPAFGVGRFEESRLFEQRSIINITLFGHDLIS